MKTKEKVKKPFYKTWWVWILAVIIIIAIASGGDEEGNKVADKESDTEVANNIPDEKKETAVDKSAYTAENVYTWFLESGLISGDKKEDDTAEYKGSEGVVSVIDAGEVSITEFETEEQAEKYDSSDIVVVHKNIYVLLVQAQSQRDSFSKVLEAGKPLSDLETSYASEEQKQVAELMKNGSGFLPLIEAYYNLPKDQKSVTWDDFMAKNIVTWSGTIADLEAIGDSIVVYGGNNYNGEDWSTISTEKKDMMPFTFIVELKDESMKQGLKQGDKVKLQASLDSRGDKEMQYNWKLYEGEVIK